MTEAASENQPAKKFGTFLGVFLPSLLTVLGLIMYLRFGWILGNLGLGLTLLAVFMANVITFITGLSAAAIATNIKMGVGGVYFLVSRSLGLETGGAIGLAFYISRTLSITFYAFGLAESILIFWPPDWGPLPASGIPVLTALVIVLITFASGRSAELVLKFQVPMFVLVVLSLLALGIGVFTQELHMPTWSPTYFSAPGGFWMVFAVLFPGVTGFLAGIAMSGDLKNPGRSIARGTIWSVLTGLAIYLLIPSLLAITAVFTLEELADPELGLETWTRVAFLGGLFIYPAAWGAILSSAIGSVLSGPRVLQSLSQDGLAPRFLSRLSKTGQPTLATWVTGGIALLAVALGDLNTVATFVTVLFLTLYVVINLVAALENLAAEPSFRPGVRVPWYLSVFGALGALYVIYLISPWALLLAVLLEGGFYLYFSKRALEQRWGDVKAGLWMRLARYSLLQMNRLQIKARNWRPIILLFAQDINERMELVKLAAAFGQNRGILTVARLVFETGDNGPVYFRSLKREMLRDLQQNGLEAFCEVVPVSELHQGMLNVSKGHGIGGLKTNTIMFGWSGKPADNVRQLRIIRDLSDRGKNIALVRFNDHESWKAPVHNRIDIWWGGHENNGTLMLILAYMLQLNKDWKQARIRICSVVEHEAQREPLLQGVKRSLAESRIRAEVAILLKGESSLPDVIGRESLSADIVFLGLRISPEGAEAAHAQTLDRLSRSGKTVVFVRNNSMPEIMPILLGNGEDPQVGR